MYTKIVSDKTIGKKIRNTVNRGTYMHVLTPVFAIEQYPPFLQKLGKSLHTITTKQQRQGFVRKYHR